MPASLTLEELASWNERILAAARSFGLDPYPQEFEVCDHEQMLAYMVYSGMPSHYPHWSYGKSFEKLKTLYDYGVSGLPYEMVINSNPSIAYLMRDNSLLLQVLTIAHVTATAIFQTIYFNRAGRNTQRDFKAHQRVAGTSRITSRLEKVERSSRRHALFCNAGAKWPSAADSREGSSGMEVKPSATRSIYHRARNTRAGVNRAALPESLDFHPRPHQTSRLGKGPVTIVHAERNIIAMETKIMKRVGGLWHKRVRDALDLPQGLQMSLVRHNKVLSPPRSHQTYTRIKSWRHRHR